jgi:acetoacetyl-CoA synthetase
LNSQPVWHHFDFSKAQHKFNLSRLVVSTTTRTEQVSDADFRSKTDKSLKALWHPSQKRILDSHLNRFLSDLKSRGVWTGSTLSQDAQANRSVVAALHRWSIELPGIFWRRVWDYAGLIGELGDLDHNATEHLWQRRFFPDGRLNFAENLLKPQSSSGSSLAITAMDESLRTVQLNRKELCDRVFQLSRCMQSLGIGPGDRVAAVMPNSIEAIVAFLATSAIGGIWTCCSPEFGDDAIVDRFAQTAPKLLIHATASWYNGKRFDQRTRIESLEKRLPNLEATLIVENDGGLAVGPVSDRTWRDSPRVTHWYSDVMKSQSTEPIEFKRFAFNHPLYILYSSGTTGSPKCIVHGAGGTLLQHVKEHQLHSDIHPQDRLFYFTTTGWMMWNWLTSALASDASIYLYDGSPVFPDHGVLWQMAQEHRITHFGASARYYAALEKQPYEPNKHVQVDSIRVVMSTGSPLLPEQFEWIYRSVHADVHLASISGGTDIVSCFVLGNPTIPVLAGEIQSKGLGMDVRVVDDRGARLSGIAGELVCANAVPSMPLGFWNDPDGDRYRDTYWNRFPNVWWHGDWAMETESGGMIIYGRSDSTLNPGGVRIGTAEIYRQLEAFPEILESVATAKKEDGDEKIVLFVKLRPGTAIDADWVTKVKQRLRSHCSPRHVPSWVVQAPDLPKTMNGKLSEIAVRNAICGMAIGNAAALANPECLAFFQNWKP